MRVPVLDRKRVLVVSYYFPPSGGPGVQRILKFVKYLPDFGFDPAVLTVAEGDYPARDESLLDEIPAGVPVLRTRIPEPYGLYRRLTGKKKGSAVDVNVNRPRGQRVPASERLAEWVRGMFFVPDARVGWLLTGVRPGIEFARRIRADIVYSSSPPYTCALLGRAIAQGAGIPWVPELRDPWTEFLSAPRRPEPARAFDRRLERGVYHDAPRLVIAWSGIGADLRRKYPEEDPSKFRLVPNGYDLEDMSGVEPVQNPRFTMVYTGSLYGVRNPETFLEAIGRLLARGDLDPDRVRIRFIGRFGEEVRTMFRNPDVAPVVEERGYLPHADSVAELLGAHALLLVVDDVPGSEHIVPGKVFEYLGARRPILAVGPEGDVAQLVRSIGAGTVLARRDVEGISRVVSDLYREWLATGSTVYRGDLEMTERQSRRERTRDLARVLGEVVKERHGA
jgi:glycosyltransferase involved in cell wall biosynthesis